MPNSARTGTGSAGFLPVFAATTTGLARRASRPRIASVMTGSIRSVCIGVATAALALGLGACNQTTYGTGTPVGMQTIEDLAGIADLGGPKKDPIKYTARPGLVQPPAGAPLPPPGSEQQAVAANWPNDPDAQAKRFKEQVAAREKFCADATNDDTARVPRSGLPPAARRRRPTPRARRARRLLNRTSSMPANGRTARRRRTHSATKLFADAKGQVAVDENGKPIRRYLTDPPSDYRVPDPNAPVVIDNKPATKKKWKWPWQ